MTVIIIKSYLFCYFKITPLGPSPDLFDERGSAEPTGWCAIDAVRRIERNGQ